MRTEWIIDGDSFDGSEGLLAVAVLTNPAHGPGVPPGLHYVTGPADVIQAAVMLRPKGEVIGPHQHPPFLRATVTTGEVIAVRKGLVDVAVYNSRRAYVRSVLLLPGDFIVLLAGGHSFTMLEESEILEVRNGPYAGPLDKVKWDA